MELIKKHHQKIISFGLVIIGIIIFIIIAILHGKIDYYWYPLFMICAGLTLAPLSKDNDEK